MVDILSAVFKRFSSQLHCADDLRVRSVEQGVLVLGEENIKRTLLFLAAVTAASELGVKVLFFTQSQIQSLPVTFQATGLKPECLKKIRFVYPKTLEDLLEDVASLHELVAEATALPSLIIVDGLEQYVFGPVAQDRPQRETQSTVAHVVALLHDTAAFLTQTLKTHAEIQTQCSYIVSFQPGGKGLGGWDVIPSDPILSVLERYLQVRCTLEKVRRDEGPNEWSLSVLGPGLQIDGHGYAVEWLQRVVLLPNGKLEFCPVKTTKEETPQGS